MSESDMFPCDPYPRCSRCDKRFYPETSVSLNFCSEECIRIAIKNKNPYIDRADRYFVQLCDAEARIKELESQLNR